MLFFWASQLIWGKKIFTLKISNLSHSLILSLLGTPNFRGMWHWGLVTGSDWWWAAQWWLAVGRRGWCWLVVGGSYWWVIAEILVTKGPTFAFFEKSQKVNWQSLLPLQSITEFEIWKPWYWILWPPMQWLNSALWRTSLMGLSTWGLFNVILIGCH